MFDTSKAAARPGAPAGRKVIAIEKEQDIAWAAREARAMAEDLGFSPVKVIQVSVSVMELATNLFVHALPGGRLCLDEIREQDQVGIEVIAADAGPGIDDIDLAMQDRYSTAGSMGCGLPAVQRLMDEFEIISQAGGGNGCGTTVTARKWRR